MTKETLPKVDVKIESIDVETVIAAHGKDGVSAIDIGKEMGIISDDMDALKQRAVASKLRSFARRIVKSKGWSTTKVDGKALYCAVPGSGETAAKDKAQTAAKEAGEDD